VGPPRGGTAVQILSRLENKAIKRSKENKQTKTIQKTDIKEDESLSQEG
jgi:hypothetical protein